ncbi:CD109 molecule, partial [Chamberlinius hualienensis]
MEKYISYQITGKGKLLLAKTAALEELTDRASFSFQITREMSPIWAIAAFYVSSCGEIVGDSLTMNTDGAIQTPLTLKFSKNQTEPGDSLNIGIESSPDTTVALLATDQSVLLLSKGNDITKSQIYDELNRYGMDGRGYYSGYSTGKITRPSGTTVDQIFQAIGVQLLTNGIYFKLQNCRYNDAGFDYDGLQSDPMPKSTASRRSGVDASGHVQPTSVRTHFPETWLWTSVTTDKNGGTVLETKIPDTITSWVITGFALNSKTGLGLTDRTYNVTVFKPFFLVVNLPYQVIRGETIAIQVLVFNYLSQDLEVFVTLESDDGHEEEYVVVDNTPTKIVNVTSNGIQTTSFLVQPIKVGFIPLQFKATSPLAGDAIRQSLRVK